VALGVPNLRLNTRKTKVVFQNIFVPTDGTSAANLKLTPVTLPPGRLRLATRNACGCKRPALGAEDQASSGAITSRLD
jgi:hypothetical protein